jgi:hypothetical protein
MNAQKTEKEGSKKPKQFKIRNRTKISLYYQLSY